MSASRPPCPSVAIDDGFASAHCRVVNRHVSEGGGTAVLRVAFVCVLVVVGITALTGAVANAGHIAEPPPKHPKLALELRREIAQGQLARASLSPAGISDRVKVQLDMRAGDTASVLPGIEADGGIVLGAIPGSVEADVPASTLESIAAR